MPTPTLTSPPLPPPPAMHPLTFYFEQGVKLYKEPMSRVTLAEASTAYTAARRAHCAAGQIKPIHFGGIRRHMTRLAAFFPGLLLSELTPERITAFCDHNKAGVVTHNLRRNLISKFLEFAVEKDWLARNPIAKVEHFQTEHMRGDAPTITAARAAELMAYLETYEEGRFVPYYALCLFAGLRPDICYGEMAKLPLSAIKAELGFIRVTAQVSKVKMPRDVFIQPNLAAWLTAWPPSETRPILAKGLVHHRRVIAEKFGLSPDVMRHTFISMMVAATNSKDFTAMQAGNSVRIINKHYYAVKMPSEAEAFFRIAPKQRGDEPGVAAALKALKALKSVVTMKPIPMGGRTDATAEPTKPAKAKQAQAKKMRVIEQAEGQETMQPVKAARKPMGKKTQKAEGLAEPAANTGHPAAATATTQAMSSVAIPPDPLPAKLPAELSAELPTEPVEAAEALQQAA